MTNHFFFARSRRTTIVAALSLIAGISLGKSGDPSAGISLEKSGNPTDCKQTILRAYHQMAGLQAGSSGIHHVKFTSTTISVAPGQRATRETIVRGELYSQGKRGFFQTDDITMWQDGQYIVTILRPSRTVILARTLPDGAATDPRRLFMIRDTLIQLGNVHLCRSESRSKQPALQHTQLTYTGLLATRLRVKTIDFWLMATDKLQAMSIHYLPGGSAQQVDLRFPVQEFLVTSPYLPTDARAQVMTADGRLLPRYQGYRLVNQLAANR